IRADNAYVDFASLHQVASSIVDDDCVRDTVAAELVSCERRALVAWPRLVHPNMNGNAGIVGVIDRRGRGAPVDAGEPAGIAMRQHVHRLAWLLLRSDFLDELEPVDADAAAGL